LKIHIYASFENVVLISSVCHIIKLSEQSVCTEGTIQFIVASRRIALFVLVLLGVSSMDFDEVLNIKLIHAFHALV